MQGKPNYGGGCTVANEVYRELENEAMAELDRILALGVDTSDIAIVMTRDIYLALMTEMRWTADYDIDGAGICMRYCGYDVCIVNEDAETMFRAAVKGLRHYNVSYDEMDIGSFIIADENSPRLYMMTRKDPPYFTDAGLTVNFENNLVKTEEASPVDRHGRVHRHESISRYTMDPFYPAYVTYSDRLSSAGMWKSERPPKESELSRVDTKELDDFLSSFAKKGTLESAT